jgi:hypothetical protein
MTNRRAGKVKTRRGVAAVNTKAGKKRKSVSLTDRERMGGPIGAGGYDFQTRYAIVRLPQLLGDKSFTHMLSEGLEDLDINFGAAASPMREAVQVKDHEVRLKEFQSVVTKFSEIDGSHPNVFARFTLACPSLGREVKSLASKLERLRNAEDSFAGGRKAVVSTVREITQTLKSSGLGALAEFIIAKVFMQVGLPNLHDDDTACDAFVAAMKKLPAYREKPPVQLGDVYTMLFRQISSARAASLGREQIMKSISSTLRRASAGRSKPAEGKSTVDIFTKGKLEKSGRVKRMIGRKGDFGSMPANRKTIVGREALIEGQLEEMTGEINKEGR